MTVDPDSKEGRRLKRAERRRHEALGSRDDAHNHVLREDVEALKEAAAAGADLEEPDDDGCTPACFAVMRNSGVMLDALAECGVDLSDERAAGESSASLGSIAATRGSVEALRALRGHVDLGRHSGRDGWTAPGAAALQGNAAAIDALNALGVALDLPCNRHGETPATVARKVGNRKASEAIARALMDQASRHQDCMPEE